MTDSNRTAPATTPSRRSRLQPRVLEARVLLDAAAVETAVAVAAEAIPDAVPVVDTSALFDAPAATGRREAYVVDTSVEGYEGLLAAIPEGAELFLIDGRSSGLEQVNAALGRAGGQFDAIHVVSHGAGGALKLGADTITAGNVNNYRAELKALGSHLTEKGDVMLYGCDIAGNAEGARLLTSLASLTGADVAASTDATGGPNGDGELEAWAGSDSIQTDPWAAVAALDDPLALQGYYAGREDGDTGGATGASLGVSMDSDGDWVVAGSKDGTVRVWNASTLSEQIFTDPDTATAGFGQAVAISGNRMVVADAGAGTVGYLYVYELNGSTWSLLRTIDVNAEIAGVNARIGGWTDGTYGGGQWLDISGNHILIGVPNEGSSGNGQGRVVWMADASSGAWSNINAGYFDEPNNWGGSFGAAVSIANSVFVIGAPTYASGDGAIIGYAWTAGATTGPGGLANGSTSRPAVLFDEYITANGSHFGAALDIGFNATTNRYTLAVGAPGENSTNGELYVYQSGVGNTTFGGAYNLHSRDGDASNYGVSIKVKDNKILVGAAGGNGAVFLYTNSAANGAWGTGNTSNLPASTTETVTVGSAGDAFGRSVAFAGSSGFLVGATGYGNDDRGAVYTYGVTGLPEGHVIATNGTTNDQLGHAVDAQGEWVVAGGNGNAEVQVWRVVGETRTEQKIAPPPGSSSAFGGAVSIDGNTFVVGDANAGTAGKVFVYQLNTTTNQWVLATSLDVASISGWGTARIGGWADANGGNQWLAVSENRIAVGAPSADSNTGRVAWFADTSNAGDVGTWTAVAKGYLDDPAPASYGSDGQSPARFGAAIAIAKDALVIGGPTTDTETSGGMYSSARNDDNHGAVFIHQWLQGSVGAPNAGASFLLNGNADMDGVQTGDDLPALDSAFGAALDVDYYNPDPTDPSKARYTIVVGAPAEDSGKGEVYIYQTTSNSLTGFAAASNIYGQTTGGGADKYGLAVSVSQGRIIVGAPNHDAVTDNAVFFYEKANNVWTGLDTNNPGANGINVLALTPSSFGATGGSTNFGRAVAFSNGNNIAAGAPMYAADDRGTVAFFYARTPVAVNDSFTINEDSGVVTFNVKDGTSTSGQNGPDDIFGSESDATVTVTPELPGSVKGTLVWNADSNEFTFNPNGQFEYLSAGQSEVISMRYKLTTTTGGYTFSSYATVTLTVTGVNDAPVVDAGISGITIPRLNEPNGNPSGAQAPSTGSVELPFNAFGDVDQIDILTYSALSITKVGGAGTATVAPTITTGGNIVVSGTYNKGTGVNTGSIAYNMAGLDATYVDTVWRITVQASDGNGGTITTTFDFTIARDNENPELNPPIPNMNATEDTVFVYDFEADDNVNLFGYFRDPDTTSGPYPERLTYSIVSQSGAGADWLSISADGVLTGAPSNDNVGVTTVQVKVTDRFGNSITGNAFTITVGNTNDAPVLVNDIDRKVSIKGETFSFNVESGALTWGGGGAPNNDVGPYPSPNNFFYDIDNSTADSRSPSSGDTITYTAYNAVSGTQITTLGTGGNASGANDVSWLAFNGTTFSGTSAGVLGSTITIRLRATDNHGAYTETEFEIGIFPRDGAGVESGALPTPEYAAQMGYDVAINSGTTAAGQGQAGKWAVVGAPGANNRSGAVYVYENTAATNATPTWVLRHTFTNALANARLGTSVDISANGMRIVAGAPNEDTNGATAGSRQGAVYFYENNGSGVWAAYSTPKASVAVADANNGDLFGGAVAINENGSFVLVGAPSDDEAGVNAGAAYAFGFGVATAGDKLLPTSDGGTDTRAGDMFGSAVAFDQNLFVIGAPRDTHSGKQHAGSVYVVSTDNPWSTTTGQFAKLKKAATAVDNYDYFGTSVDVDVFGGGGRDSVYIVVGTPKDDAAGEDAGATYVFNSSTMVADHTNAGGLTSIVQLGNAVTAYDAVTLQEFGWAVAVDVDELTGQVRMAVGSSLNAAFTGVPSTGAAYAYRYWSGTGWLGQRYLPSTSAVKFGYAVDVGASIFMAGSPDNNRTGGAASTDYGTLQLEAGSFYSFNSQVATSGQTPIEALSSAAPIDKVADSDQPAPVILSSGSGAGSGGSGTSTGAPLGLFASLLGDDREEEWAQLLRPVTDWSLGAKDARFMAAANSPLASVSSYADAVLFDQRTVADKEVLQAVVTDEQQEPVPQEDAPENEGKQPETPTDAPLAALLKGFSHQLDAANGARARDARQLLASLDSLAG